MEDNTWLLLFIAIFSGPYCFSMACVEASAREYGDGSIEPLMKERVTNITLVYNWKNEMFNKAAPILAVVREYPIASLFIGVLLGFSLVPLIIFWSIVAVSGFLTFVGFLMVEGTIVTFALVWLSVVLFWAICLSILLSCFLGIVWYTCSTAANYGAVNHAVSVFDQYLPGVKPKMTQFFTVGSPKKE